MAIEFTLTIDPAAVLGVARDATLEEVRDAYRAKAKRYHPDAGGEDWAFRILSQSYEILSQARVARATDRESPAPPPRPRPQPRRPRTPPPPPPTQEMPSETVRPGAQDVADDPTRVVDIERLSVRHQADHVWLITERSAGQVLSCSLNVAWPDPALTTPPADIPGAADVLRTLNEVLETLRVQSRALTSRASVEEGRFSGWVSYPNVDRAAVAFARLRDLLRARGLAVKQRSRDLIIPRD